MRTFMVHHFMDAAVGVPACAQHSVLDPGENARLRTLLPLTVSQR